MIRIQTMVYKRLWCSHKFSQVFMIRQAIITGSYYSQLLSLLNRRTWYLFRAYWRLWRLRVLLLLLCSCTVLFLLIWLPIYLKVYYDFGDCSFILTNVWKVGCICSTVTQTKFTVTKCINYKHHKNILILMEIPFLNRLDIFLLCIVLKTVKV